MTSVWRDSWALLRYQGPSWLAQRAWYAFQLQSGLVRRRMPAAGWEEASIASAVSDPSLGDADRYLRYRQTAAPPFFFTPSILSSWRPRFEAWDRGGRSAISEADAIERGTMRYFGHLEVRTGFPPDWHTDALSGRPVAADRHWSTIDDFSGDDIKLLWEPGRFGFVFALVRAYARTGDARYAEIFWRTVEDWCERNPPNLGVHWKCGQEMTFRLMAWCYGLYAFLEIAASTAARVTMLGRAVASFGDRIEANLSYALSQRNNHGISEATGLWTIGTLFPEFRAADRWRRLAQGLLARLTADLIDDDGGFSQHSFNYQRLAIHDLLWACRLGDLGGTRLDASVHDRLWKAARLLFGMQDDATGALPRYGHDDGSLILRLTNCDDRDYRPALQTALVYLRGTRVYDDGPWDEEALWMLGSAALDVPLDAPIRVDCVTEPGGYCALRTPEGFLFTRAPAVFRHRPAHADLLHVDVWWRGQNMALDPGTYSYNAPAPWSHALAGTSYHNTVTVDGADQMNRAGRFLWLPWPEGKTSIQRTGDGVVQMLEVEHDGYRRLSDPVRHRRAIVRLPGEHWLILDRLTAMRTHGYRLHWLLNDSSHEWDDRRNVVRLDTPAGDYRLQVGSTVEDATATLVRADPASPRGWQAVSYQARRPALSVDLTTRGATVLLWTVVGPDVLDVTLRQNSLEVVAETWDATASVLFDAAGAIVREFRRSTRSVGRRHEETVCGCS